MPGMPANLKEALFFHLFPDPFSSPLNSQLGTCQDRREEIKIKYTINTEGEEYSQSFDKTLQRGKEVYRILRREKNYCEA